MGKIQGISISDGKYSLENRRSQTFHEPGCVHAHDPRLQCLRQLTKFHSYFGIVLPSLISDEGISPHTPPIIKHKGEPNRQFT